MEVPSDPPERCPVCDAAYDSVSVHDDDGLGQEIEGAEVPAGHVRSCLSSVPDSPASWPGPWRRLAAA